MIYVGALIGGILAALAHLDWLVPGVVLGAIVGWIVKQKLRDARGPGVAALEARLDDVTRRYDSLAERVRMLEAARIASDPSSAASSFAPAALPQTAPPAAVTAPPLAVTAPTVAPVLDSAEPHREPDEPNIQWDDAPVAASAASDATTTAPSDVEPSDRPRSIWNWIAGGNPVARVGVIVLFFGVAFLMKFAYDRYSVPIEVRLIAVALGAIAMLVGGWRLRERRPDYGLVLQGAGVGLLYLVVFGALKLTGVMPPALAFALLVAIAGFSALLAVVQDSLVLAVMGISGGFLAPILVSTGQGSHVMLFSYYAVLNAGILAIAWHRAWRALNLLGFVFTFVIGTLWGVTRYRPEAFASTEPFLILFFLFYVGVALLYARARAPALRSYVDGTLIFGVPVIAFGLQVGLVQPYEFGASFSAAALGAFYIALATWLFRRAGDGLRLLVEAFLALGIVFATLAIPLAMDGRMTAAVWGLEGAAIVWVSVRQQRLLGRLFGYLLIVAAGLAFLFDVDRAFAPWPIANSFTIGCVLLAAAGIASAFALERGRDLVRELETSLVRPTAFGWGVAWWIAGGWHEIHRQLAADARPSALIGFFILTALGSSVGSRWLQWPLAARPIVGFLPVLAVCLAISLASVAHPFTAFGFLAWPAALATHYWLLRRHELESSVARAVLHAGSVWLVAVVGSWELGWHSGEIVAGGRVWSAIAWAVFPGVLLAALLRFAPRIDWPFRAELRAYLLYGLAPIIVFLGLWSLAANALSSGNPAPLPYVPLLNPLDVSLAGIIVAIVAWLFALEKYELADWLRSRLTLIAALIGALAFIDLNGTLVRTIHHWAAVPFDWDVLLRSRLVQTGFSILWTLIALGATVAAQRWQHRALWSTGAGLLIVVALKLFFIDFAGHDVERIVSFIGVGLLMVAIGYFAPLPPKSSEIVATKEAS